MFNGCSLHNFLCGFSGQYILDYIERKVKYIIDRTGKTLSPSRIAYIVNIFCSYKSQPTVSLVQPPRTISNYHKMGAGFSTIENSTFHSSPWKSNKGYWSSFELYPEWASRSYYVFKGIAHHEREYLTGTMVAVKTLREKTGEIISWDHYKQRSEKARRIGLEFNKLLDSSSSTIRVNFLKPIDAMMENISDVMKFTRFIMRFDKKFAEKEVVLFEDLLEGEFSTFVTSAGSTTSRGSEVLDAFCHYSYHTSGGNLVVCNLKGIEEEGHYSFTNPTIHSLSCCYGNNDYGVSGITTFFNNHICNAMCEHFMKPCLDADGSPSAPPLCYSDDIVEAWRESTSPPKYAAIYPEGPPSTIAKELKSWTK